MVCEKLNESIHDFLKDEIKLVVDGDFLKQMVPHWAQTMELL